MDMLFVLAASIGAWAFTAKKLSNRHFAIRHAAGLVASFIAVFFTIIIGQDLGLIERHDDITTNGAVTIFLVVSALIIYGAVKFMRLAAKRTKNKPKAADKRPNSTPATVEPQPEPTEMHEAHPAHKGSRLLTKEQKKKFKHYPGHKKPAPPPPPVTCQSTPDSEQPSHSEALSFAPLDGDDSVVVHFDYENAKGELSSRTVSVYKVGDTSFTGICHAQTEERTFRFDRIIGLVLLHESQMLVGPHELKGLLYGHEVVERTRRKQPTKPKQVERKAFLEILFTGFKKDQREELETAAVLKGMTVRKTVTVDLDFLCCGPNAGPVKQREAINAGAMLINTEQFKQLIETGELPDR